MYCLHCGKEIPGETIPNFCPNCGAQLRPLNAEPVPSWAPEPDPEQPAPPQEADPKADKQEDVSLPELAEKYANAVSVKPEKPKKSFWQSLLDVPPKPYIVRTYVVAEESRRSASSTALRGAIGGALGLFSPGLGLIGATAGMLSGKNKNTTTFVIEYSDGHRVTETVKNKSDAYKLYCTYLKL